MATAGSLYEFTKGWALPLQKRVRAAWAPRLRCVAATHFPPAACLLCRKREFVPKRGVCFLLGWGALDSMRGLFRLGAPSCTGLVHAGDSGTNHRTELPSFGLSSHWDKRDNK